MKRSNFLKTIAGIFVAPTVLLNSSFAKEEKKEIDRIVNYHPYPIYPQVNESHTRIKDKVEHNYFTYVKITRNGVEYLVAVREWNVGDDLRAKERFLKEVKAVQDNYVINERLPEFNIKYDPKIHNNNYR